MVQLAQNFRAVVAGVLLATCFAAISWAQNGAQPPQGEPTPPPKLVDHPTTFIIDIGEETVTTKDGDCQRAIIKALGVHQPVPVATSDCADTVNRALEFQKNQTEQGKAPAKISWRSETVVGPITDPHQKGYHVRYSGGGEMYYLGERNVRQIIEEEERKKAAEPQVEPTPPPKLEHHPVWYYVHVGDHSLWTTDADCRNTLYKVLEARHSLPAKTSECRNLIDQALQLQKNQTEQGKAPNNSGAQP